MEPPAFAAQLRQHRVAAGLSQEALAARAGISPHAVSALERGTRRAPRRETVRILAETLALSPEQAAALEDAVRRRRRPRPATSPTPPGVPRFETSVLGREIDRAVLGYLLRRPEVRLLTLTGPDGVGKTRLAAQAAIDAAPAFPDGVVWVDLGQQRGPNPVAAMIASRLGLGRHEASTLDDLLVDTIRPKQLLLVLDSAELVLRARDLPQRLLDSCPGLRVLATSNGPLGLRGEREQAIGPLALPQPGLDDPLTIAAYAAVALFVARARAVVPGVTLTATTAVLIAELCRRLEGLPLAIELAAALVKLLPPQSMLAQLTGTTPDDGPDATTHGERDRRDRNQIMRDTIAWSHDLLERDEQTLFRRLAIFAGGWTAAAALAVVAGDDEDAATVASLLGALLDKRLVRHEDSSKQRRYGMHAAIREHAATRLALSGEAAAVRSKHAAYYLALAERAAPELTGPGPAHWQTQLEVEQGNLRAARAWVE